jgi:hypothetical protein
MELAADLGRVLGRAPDESQVRFRSLYLIDDFSASGTSYCRHEVTGFKGKVISALRQLTDLGSLIDPADIDVNVLLYVATTTAEQRIRDRLAEWKADNYPDAKLSVHVLQTIGDSERVLVEPASPLEALLKKYFDATIVDNHYKKGAHARPYLGFDENALPLILAHNTPNNSLPILWFDSTLEVVGLFPRVRRHKEAHEGA